ncbi:proline dehydrogenase [Clarireedia jacksonii]
MPFIRRPYIKVHTGIDTTFLSSTQSRWQSSAIASHGREAPSSVTTNDLHGSRKNHIPAVAATHLARLSTRSILRSIFLSKFLTSPFLYNPGFALFERIANSPSSFSNPDKNPLIRVFVRPLIYDQFCAGTNAVEIRNTSSEIKRLGFSGIVLCYAKEVQVSSEKEFLGYDKGQEMGLEREIAQWREGTLKTLDMVQEGDWLGIKFSGAGLHITNALIAGHEPPQEFVDAFDAICERAVTKDCRIWIDSEQQLLQPAIDTWTFTFMKKYNKGSKPMIYNTVQAYLKESRDKIEHQLQLSQRENWRLGIKLVRGAYINNDIREKIHDTKADTDESYNSIVRDLLSGNFPAFKTYESPKFDLLLAGHNTHTIRTAAQLATSLAAESKLKVVPEFAQLQGMADDIGCEVLQMGDGIKNDIQPKLPNDFSLRVYKCLTWGSVQECMQYLLRRLVENRGAADRMGEGIPVFVEELKRRLKAKVWGA